MGFVLSSEKYPQRLLESIRESTLQQFADLCSHAHGIPCFSISDVRVLFLCQDLLQNTLAPPFAAYAFCTDAEIHSNFGQFSEG